MGEDDAAFGVPIPWWSPGQWLATGMTGSEYVNLPDGAGRIRSRLEHLASCHLEGVQRRLIGGALDLMAAQIGVGDDPVVLTDAAVDGTAGLWVLTLEQCLWEPAGDAFGTDADIALDWKDAVGVRTVDHNEHLSGVSVSWRDRTVVFETVGDHAWAAELAWVVEQLASDYAAHWCPTCRLPVADEVDRCVLCEAELRPHSADGMVGHRLLGHSQAVPPAAAKAAAAAVEGLYPWVITPATLDGDPVVVAAGDTWMRAWDGAGACRLSFPLGELEAVAEPHEDAWEVVVEGSDGSLTFLGGFDDPGVAIDVADRLARPAIPTAGSVPQEANAVDLAAQSIGVPAVTHAGEAAGSGRDRSAISGGRDPADDRLHEDFDLFDPSSWVTLLFTRRGRHIALGIGAIVLLAGAIFLPRIVRAITQPTFAVGDCVRIEQQFIDHDLKSVNCADAVGTFDPTQRVYRVNDVIDGTTGGCPPLGGFFPVEFVHEPDDVTYCLVQAS